MATPLDPIQATSAAWERATELMFRPFRFSFWWRMAFLAFMTGEMSSGGGTNFNIPTDLGQHSNSTHRLMAAPDPFAGLPLAVLVLAILAGLVFMVVFAYLGSVFRFVLFDAVLTGRYRLREGFARWQSHGTRFFVWSIGYGLVMLTGIGLLVLIGVAQIVGVKRGDVASILVLVIAVLLGLAVLLAGAVIFVLTKDFVLPIMAFEGVPATVAWGRLRKMMSTEPMTYLGYIGMKILLAMGAGIVAGIASLMVLLVFVIVGVIAALVIVPMHLGWNIATIALAILFGGVAVLVLLFLMGMITAPIAVFFQAYALYFFGRRFRPLEMVMFPEPPAPPPSPALEPAPAV